MKPKHAIKLLVIVTLIINITFSLTGCAFVALKEIADVVANDDDQNIEVHYDSLIVGRWKITEISEYGEIESVNFSSYAVFNDDATGYISIDGSKMTFTWKYWKYNNGSAYFRCVNQDNEVLYATTPTDNSDSLFNKVFIAPEEDPESMVLVFTKE